ncbi:MAG: peptide chain release factor N(5)-glutamine methyltransferase [Bdellovibrionota bacterium]
METPQPSHEPAKTAAKTMLLKDVLQKTTLFFRDKGVEPARLETELLLAHGLGWNRVKLYLNYEYELSEEELTKCRELVRRRSFGEPVAYILGAKDFYKHTFKVTSDVLIPRPETESIVEEAVAWSLKQDYSLIRVVDIGSGSGCIGLSILAEVSTAHLVSIDLSEKALAITLENAEALGVADRTKVIAQDAAAVAYKQVAAKFTELDSENEFDGADVVVANPPYISKTDPEVQESVKKYEPHMALFSDDEGFAHIKAWALTAAKVARAGAFVMFEIGHEQGAKAKKIFEETGFFEGVEIVRDLAGLERFVRCTARGEKSNG